MCRVLQGACAVRRATVREMAMACRRRRRLVGLRLYAQTRNAEDPTQTLGARACAGRFSQSERMNEREGVTRDLEGAGLVFACGSTAVRAHGHLQRGPRLRRVSFAVHACCTYRSCTCNLPKARSEIAIDLVDDAGVGLATHNMRACASLHARIHTHHTSASSL